MLVRKRLDPAIFNLPVEKMRTGYYADQDLCRAQQVLLRDGYHPQVQVRVYQRQEVVVCGTDEAIAILKLCSGYMEPDGRWHPGWKELQVMSLYDGERAAPEEAVMTIAGDYALFAHLETDFLGVLARRTRVATNTTAVVEAAGGKPVLFFPARFDHHLMQTGDGYAAYISGALGVGTDAQGAWWGRPGMVTVPPSFIACYGGDAVRAAEAFARHLEEGVNLIVPVETAEQALAVAGRLGRRLWGVRLDWGEAPSDRPAQPLDLQAVWHLRRALDRAGGEFVRIVVSGDLTPEKIRALEDIGAPVDAYAVGRFLLQGDLAYYAEVVEVDGRPCARPARSRPNPRLSPVE
ncbi:MAG: quinolinate phosphoribosyl transferase [Chloroflexia bacterium]